MKKSFFRKIAFGLPYDADMPQDPIAWAIAQIKTIPTEVWQEKIYTGDEMLARYGRFVYEDRRKLRKKFKKNRQAYKAAKNTLRYETGQRYFEAYELNIRHYHAIHSQAPVFERFYHFWGNHFAISEKDFLRDFSVGPYQREIIRPLMLGKFDELLKQVTTSWCMIHHLDNSESIGPDSRLGKKRRRKDKITTINENHARELLELHSVSSNAHYTQDDVINLTYIMSGWEHPRGDKREECNPVKFNHRKHQPGDHIVMGKTYENSLFSPQKRLYHVIKDLAAHPSCREFISYKLCRHFITDYPTKEMIAPIIKAWKDSDGDLPTIHAAVIRQAYDHADKTQKFQTPENWFLQMVTMGKFDWPFPPKDIANYDFSTRPNKLQLRISRILKEIGHPVYAPLQPNGFSDLEHDWLSPELLIRRFAIAYEMIQRFNNSMMSDTLQAMIDNNIDDKDSITALLDSVITTTDKMVSLFTSSSMLRA